MSPVEVLQVITDADRRGAQVAAMELHEALAELGWSVRTVAMAPGQLSTRLDVPVLGRSRFSGATLQALRRETAERAVVIACGSSTLPACALTGIGSGVPMVYRSIGDLRFWANTPLRQARVRLALRRATAVVALWQGAAERLVRDFGVAPERVVVIPNGVSAQHFPPVEPAGKPDARRRLGLHPQHPTLVCLGALSREKNVAAAIRALEELPDCQLVVAGDGPDRRRLGELAERHAPGRVLFAGVVSAPAEVFAAADVLLLPSLSEGMPAALIEAGLSGLPSVTTDVGGVRDIVVAGETGDVIPTDRLDLLPAAIRTALEKEGSYGEAARLRCLERFEIGVVATRWDDLLKEITGE